MRARIILAGLLLLALLAGIEAIRRAGEKAGAARVERQVAREHAARAAEARSDERSAGAIAEAIARRVARSDNLTSAAVQADLKEIHDAIDDVAPAAAGAPLPAAPVERLRDALNAGVARANRAADLADAAG